MFKTDKNLSSEAEILYAEHKAIHSEIAKNKEYVDDAEKMMDLMVASGAGSDTYVDDMQFDIRSVKNAVGRLETKAVENVDNAAEHLRANPQLFTIAVKSATRDGVDIKTK